MRISLLTVLIACFTLPLTADRRRPVALPQAGDIASWLQTNATPITATHDFAPLLQHIGSRRIVVLGEAAHGTHELFELKIRVLETLIEREGIRAIAFEGLWPEFNLINRYIQGKEGYAPALIRHDDYWFWNSGEILELVIWLREFNASRASTDRVVIRGIDPILPRSAINDVIAYLASVDPAASSRAEKNYSCFDERVYDGRSEYSKSLCRAAIISVRERFEGREEDYVSKTGRNRYQEVLESARIVEQAERAYGAPSIPLRSELRDAAMAENTAKLATEHGRVVVWAHNGHTSYLPYQSVGDNRLDAPARSMSSFLREQFPGEVYTLGTTFGGGLLHAIYRGSQGLVIGPVYIQGIDDSYGSILERSGAELLFVPLRDYRLPIDLVRDKRLVIIGSGFDQAELDEYAPYTRLSASFDGLIFVRSVRPSSLRR